MATSSPEPRGKEDLEERKSKFEKGILSKATFLQFAGVWLTLIILLLIAVFVGAILGYLWGATPPIGSFGNPVTESSLNLYLKTSDAVFNRGKDLLDMVLFKVLFPTLTAVLGYTFAQVRQNSTREE